MSFPKYRPRRLRKNEMLRRMVRETTLSADDLILPLFVTFGRNVKKPISSMPGHYQMSVDNLAKEAKEIKGL
ncbi:MAG TPA: porphobilinogen synthase, partial [Thermodesulfobacteriota bacterium]|nr:porphobilinogen synthase [Thermodesulfobacteriota bacterium]